MELLNRKVRRPVEIERALGIEPLATIPYIQVRGLNWRKRALTLAVLAIAAASFPILRDIATPGSIPGNEIMRLAHLDGQ
jgi:hypothetical protein